VRSSNFRNTKGSFTLERSKDHNNVTVVNTSCRA